MEMMQSILVTVVVSFGLMSNNQLDNIRILAATISIENVDSEIQTKFRSLFDSITKNDVEGSENYQHELEDEAIKAQREFDVLKNNLQFASHMKAVKQNQFHHRNGNNDEIASVAKRETQEESPEDSIAVSEETEDFLEDKLIFFIYVNQSMVAAKWNESDQTCFSTVLSDVLKYRSPTATSVRTLLKSYLEQRISERLKEEIDSIRINLGRRVVSLGSFNVNMGVININHENGTRVINLDDQLICEKRDDEVKPSTKDDFTILFKNTLEAGKVMCNIHSSDYNNFLEFWPMGS